MVRSPWHTFEVDDRFRAESGTRLELESIVAAFRYQPGAEIGSRDRRLATLVEWEHIWSRCASLTH